MTFDLLFTSVYKITQNVLHFDHFLSLSYCESNSNEQTKTADREGR